MNIQKYICIVGYDENISIVFFHYDDVFMSGPCYYTLPWAISAIICLSSVSFDMIKWDPRHHIIDGKKSDKTAVEIVISIKMLIPVTNKMINISWLDV